MLRTAFVDRDGTINRKAPDGAYVRSVAEFVFLPGAKEALRLLTRHGVRIIVVTNQRGVALGHMTRREVDWIHARMRAELETGGAQVSGIYCCPHDIGQCDCRKPDLGLLRQAQRDHPDISPSSSVVIGDSASDIEAANRFGATGILLSTTSLSAPAGGGYRARSLLDATLSILSANLRGIEFGSSGARSGQPS